MPAEIDTGGPRVLHCDYRADCPIPIVASVSTESSLCGENRVVGTLTIVRRLPRIDENQSLDSKAVESRRCFGFSFRRTGDTSSSNRSGFRGFRRAEPRNIAFDHVSNRHRQPSSDALSCTIRRENVHYRENSFYPVQPESRLGDAIVVDRSPIDQEAITETRSGQDEYSVERETNRRLDSTRLPVPSSKHENDTGHSGGHRHRHRSHERESEEEANRCSKRCGLSTATRNWPRYRLASHVPIGKSAARFSSQSNDPSRSGDRTRYEKFVSTPSSLPSLADETWKEVDDATNSWSSESRVTKVVASTDAQCRQTDFPSFDHQESLTRSDRGTRKKKRVCSNNRSTYIQLALLLFLVAFGQCGLRKSSVVNYSAKPSTTGLSVLTIGTVISAVSAAPVDLMGDAGVRAERSANLSHITGASRKIQMYIKNRHLQILPDGTVNGSNDDTSDYTIFQRTSVSRGQLRIQGVATCLYLCMDSCGLLYGSREYTDDCVFNETLEQHNYNTYSSAKWSTAKKTLYLGLNRRGQPRRVQAKGHNLGRLSAYARVLTQVAPSDRVEALQRRLLGAQHNVRHRHNSHRGDLIQQSLCPTLPVQEKDGRDKFRCRKRKKRKKRKRRCRPGEMPGPQCQMVEENGKGVIVSGRNESLTSNGTSLDSKRSCEGAASEEACRREALSVPSKKRKLRVDQTRGGISSAGGRNIATGRNVDTSRNVTASKVVAGSRNVTASSNGERKAPASNSKKVKAAGSMSQSKKPNLTDGKRKRKKGPAAAAAAAAGRRNSTVPLVRKRFKPGKVDTTSAVPTTTLASTSVTSSSSWSSPGTSIAP
ncbi:uncharacterized protein LOC132911211 isoform X1 [Bombus pascuorum]|uniref:uncharacterized protein LOC132911211 isoform X1 n=1 Tax=Bombus pascuorum TaxID=65598 RepID=UPI002129CF91|nr:uncharacterized protein LOC132911211 isoform X1 [Bombus pascuorum]